MKMQKSSFIQTNILKIYLKNKLRVIKTKTNSALGGAQKLTKPKLICQSKRSNEQIQSKQTFKNSEKDDRNQIGEIECNGQNSIKKCKSDSNKFQKYFRDSSQKNLSPNINLNQENTTEKISNVLSSRGTTKQSNKNIIEKQKLGKKSLAPFPMSLENADKRIKETLMHSPKSQKLLITNVECNNKIPNKIPNSQKITERYESPVVNKLILPKNQSPQDYIKSKSSLKVLPNKQDKLGSELMNKKTVFKNYKDNAKLPNPKEINN